MKNAEDMVYLPAFPLFKNNVCPFYVENVTTALFDTPKYTQA